MIKTRARVIQVAAFLMVLPWLVGGHSTAASAGQVQPDVGNLPRSFQGARLGMSQYELTSVAPAAGKTALIAKGLGDGTVTVPARDRHLKHIEYRLYRGVVREIAIYYRRDRIPGAYEGLLARLKASYGQPLAENVEEYDPRADVFSIRKTVWQDPRTKSELVEVRRVRDGAEVHDLVLTMTDRGLQQQYEEEQAHRLRQQELSVPIPLPDHSTGGRETARPAVKVEPVA